MKRFEYLEREEAGRGARRSSGALRLQPHEGAPEFHVGQRARGVARQAQAADLRRAGGEGGLGVRRPRLDGKGEGSARAAGAGGAAVGRGAGRGLGDSGLDFGRRLLRLAARDGAGQRDAVPVGGKLGGGGEILCLAGPWFGFRIDPGQGRGGGDDEG